MKSSPSIWRYVVNVKSTVKISSIIVAFLGNMNFNNSFAVTMGPSIQIISEELWLPIISAPVTGQDMVGAWNPKSMRRFAMSTASICADF